MISDINIKCPICDWHPSGTEQWMCHNCQNEWDVFSTVGRCPTCRETKELVLCPEWCGGCDESSPFLDWHSGLDDGLREINVEKNS